MKTELTDKQIEEIQIWMEVELKESSDEYDDLEQIDRTKLGEAAIEKFGLFGKIDEDGIWELAHEVASEWEADNEVEGESWTEKSQDYWRTVTR